MQIFLKKIWTGILKNKIELKYFYLKKLKMEEKKNCTWKLGCCLGDKFLEMNR